MTLENISGRDKILFNQKLNLRRVTTSDQLLEVLAALREILNTHPKVEAGAIPVRFVGVGPYSLDIEIAEELNGDYSDEADVIRTRGTGAVGDRLTSRAAER